MWLGIRYEHQVRLFGPSWVNQRLTDLRGSQTAFGVSFSGEFSSGYNPCGLFLLGTTNTDTITGDCALFTDSSTWNDTLKEGILAFTEGSMDALQNWFFWTWKVGLSSHQRRLLNVKTEFLHCRLVIPHRAQWSRLCGLTSMGWRMVGYQRTLARASESAKP
jgi:hypothetical protein